MKINKSSNEGAGAGNRNCCLSLEEYMESGERFRNVSSSDALFPRRMYNFHIDSSVGEGKFDNSFDPENLQI